ncbi:EAL domain-containing protein [Methylobacterium komagatae]
MQYSEAVIPTKARPSVRGRVLSLGTFVATIKARIFIAFFVMSLLSGALGIYAIIAIDHVGDLVGKTYDQSLMSINYARATAADFAKMRAVFARQGLTSDKAAIAKLDATIVELHTTLAEDLTIAVERAQSDRAVRAAHAVQAGLAAWDDIRRGFGDLSTVRQDRWDALDHQADVVDAQLDMLVNYTAGDGFTFRQAARMAVNSELRLNMAAAALAIFGSALIAWLLHRRIRGPIVSASIAAERIAAGHLDDSIPTDGRDELSSLLRSMAAMRDNIRVMMEREVRQRRSAERLLTDALQSSREGVIVIDAAGQIAFANPVALQFFDGVESQGDATREAIFREALWQDGEFRLPNGRWLRVSRSAIEEGGFIAVCSDISVVKEQEDQLRETNLRLDAALDNMSQGLCLFDANDRLMVVNRRYAQIYGLPVGAVAPGMTAKQVMAVSFAGPDAGRMLTEVARGQRDGSHGPTSFPVIDELPNGKVIAIERRNTADGGFVATYEDVTERRHAEARIAFLAHHDVLTGLPNRVALEQQITSAVAQAGREQGFALFAIDLDDFRPINDMFGHAVGDELLVAVANRLSACVREIDCVARIGADEFVVVQRAVERPEDAAVLARRIIDVVKAPYVLSNHVVSVGVTLGITVAPGDGTSAGKLLKNADVALARAKAEARGSFRYFEPDMDARLQARRVLENDLRHALETEAFEVYYQPIYSLGAERVCGFEALLRWKHPVRGFISPAEFIPLAEELGLIIPLGEWVLAKACADAVRWPDGLKIAVNVSAVQFTSASLVSAVRDALRVTGLPGRRLELEITELVLVANPGTTTAILHSLKGLGVRVSMDDFGTGYSSLSYLRSFPFDKIKIDQSFVRDLCEEDGTDFIVRAVISLGASLGMTTTAEGVETEAQLARLRAEGCDEVQGYLFSRPVPITEVPNILTRWNGAARAIA